VNSDTLSSNFNQLHALELTVLNLLVLSVELVTQLIKDTSFFNAIAPISILHNSQPSDLLTNTTLRDTKHDFLFHPANGTLQIPGMEVSIQTKSVNFHGFLTAK
jgi:hypothetical protein